MSDTCLVYEGSNFFRQRLILATISGLTVKIKNIRHLDEDPGIQESEASLIRLLDKITNGSRIEVSETGTSLLYQPGLLHGGKVTHDCSLQRGISYYLEVLICLAPFCKNPLHANLRGITNNQIDPSVDSVKNSTLPVIRRFITDDEGLELKIINRGLPPGGGGEILFQCPVKRQLRPIQLTDPGKIKRIRGVAYACRVSPNLPNRIIDSTKGVLLKLLPDVYIYSDHRKGVGSGKSPGFGLSLVAETKNGTFLTADISSNIGGSNNPPSVPEDLGIQGAHLLLEEIYRGGCVDTLNQSTTCLFMALGQKDVSKIQTGPLSPYTIEMLRHMKDFLKVIFKLETQESVDTDMHIGADKVLMTCVGIGYSNLSKTTT